jgi:hypothetical protein
MKIRQLMVLLLTAGLNSGLVQADANADEYKARYDVAEAARKQAASVGGEWRDVEKFLKESQEAATAGDLEKAMKLVAKAKAHAEVGHKQAMAQQGKDLTPAYLKQ